jgi:hypothetical protein
MNLQKLKNLPKQDGYDCWFVGKQKILFLYGENQEPVLKALDEIFKELGAFYSVHSISNSFLEREIEQDWSSDFIILAEVANLESAEAFNKELKLEEKDFQVGYFTCNKFHSVDRVAETLATFLTK